MEANHEDDSSELASGNIEAELVDDQNGSPEEAQRALQILDGFVCKKSTFKVKLSSPEPRKGGNLNPEAIKLKTARESVTPLADVEYSEQLQMKTKESHRMVKNLLNKMWSAYVEDMKGTNSHNILKPIRPSPATKGYRNKCEFTVGRDLERQVRVGFVGGRFAKHEHYVLPIDECENISDQMKSIVRDFEQFVIDSGLEPFDEFVRVGTWKMLTVRELSGDVMLIFTCFPFEREKEMQEKLKERFYSSGSFSRGYRVTSLYWQKQINSSDSSAYQLIAGAPYIYETLLGVRLRVSPDSFFQTNSSAAAELYKTIGEMCSLRSDSVEDSAANAHLLRESEAEERAKLTDKEEKNKMLMDAGEEPAKEESRLGDLMEEGDTEIHMSEVHNTNNTRLPEAGISEGDSIPSAVNSVTVEKEKYGGEGRSKTMIEYAEEVPEKKMKIEDNKEDSKGQGKGNNLSSEGGTVLLDICCGTGAIGQCLMKNLPQSTEKVKKIFRKGYNRTCCIGFELVESAVEDAKANAKENNIPPNLCTYVAGKAEDSFRSLKRLVPSGFNLEECRVIGIMDPPRAGCHERVIVGCRMLSSMRRLLFVSCDPAAATKNLVDLCRPRSNKFEGEPFRLESITPVDLFPHTIHVEWVVTLIR